MKSEGMIDRSEPVVEFMCEFFPQHSHPYSAFLHYLPYAYGMTLGLIFTRAALTASSFVVKLVEIWIMKTADIANNKCQYVEVWLYCPGTTGCGAFPGTIETTPLPARQKSLPRVTITLGCFLGWEGLLEQ